MILHFKNNTHFVILREFFFSFSIKNNKKLLSSQEKIWRLEYLTYEDKTDKQLKKMKPTNKK